MAPDTNTAFNEAINTTRKQIKEMAAQLLTYKEVISKEPEMPNENRGEVIANIMLTYRHLEDASMRLGKVLQHRDGGVSVYDKTTTVGA